MRWISFEKLVNISVKSVILAIGEELWTTSQYVRDARPIFSVKEPTVEVLDTFINLETYGQNKKNIVKKTTNFDIQVLLYLFGVRSGMYS